VRISNPSSVHGVLPGQVLARSAAAEVSDTAPWLTDWAWVTLVTGAAATLVDALLLERKLSYFTGGFLSEDFLSGAGQKAAFLAGSVLTDAAVVGVFVALVLWACGRARIVRRYAVPVAFAAGLAPILAADIVAYQLREYLGDAFDFALMFDLSGRSPSEVLAVSSAHLIWFGSIAGAVLVGIGIGIVVLRRRGRSIRSRVEPVTLRRALVPAAMFVLIGLVGMSALRLGSAVFDAGFKWKPTGRLLGSVVQAVTDLDRDGTGLFGRPADPAPFDAAIRPYAAEITGNGVDENGVGGDLPASTPPYSEPAVPVARWTSKPDVVLFLLESIRGDVIGQTLRGQPVTPEMNALAARGISASRAYSHNGFTVQSRQHAFSGSSASIRGSRTLIDDFRDQGYQTAYFSAQDESFGGPEYDIGFLRADVAYDARQDVNRRFSTFATPGSLAVPYQVVVERIAAFLRERTSDKPLFLVVNFQDTHFPYYHRGIEPVLNDAVLGQFEIAPDKAEGLRAMYLNTTRNVDDAVGTVLRDVRSEVGREPGVILLSDHGESLFDEGFLGHGYSLNDVQTRIPLLVANLPMIVEEPFGQSDLRDALLAALAAPAPGSMPQLRQSATKTVFQYLGSVDRPAQIGLTGLDRQVLYDFRTGKARVNRGEWHRPEALSADDSRQWLELIHHWESMVIARTKRQ
jgi:glucan phosphoethanolaminetransferase (alkaline phosphatase superfamily)